jgi:ATP-dependent DNA ligase
MASTLTCAFASKHGRRLKRFAGLAEGLRDQLRVRDAILDGEVLALDDEGRLDFHFRWSFAGADWRS